MADRQVTARGRSMPWGIAGIAAVVLAILVAVLVARLTGYEATPEPLAPVLDSRQLGFRDSPGGFVEVFDWDSGATISRVGPGEGSFLRGVMRSLVRQRRGLGLLDVDTPFTLSRHADGRLIIRDTATEESIDLVAFGPTNVAVFVAFLDGPSAAAQPVD
jgi:putative photosynthetic complex assembly protein